MLRTDPQDARRREPSGFIGFSDEKTFAAEPKNQGPRNDRALIPGNMNYAWRQRAPFDGEALLGCQLGGTGGRALCPKGTCADAPYETSEMSASHFYSHILRAAGGLPFVWMQDQAMPHVAAANQKWLDRQMKG